MKIFVSEAEDPVRIDSDFEGGTLGRAVRLGENYYFLELRPDTPYQFRFRIRNCKGRKIVFSFRCRDYKPTLAHWNGGNLHFRNNGGLRFHREDCPEELTNVKRFARSLAGSGLSVVLAGKVHGSWTFNHGPVDFMASDPTLCRKVYEKRTEVWCPAEEAVVLTYRSKGYFERFINDELGLNAVFGCHVNDYSPEELRIKGRDLLRALFNYMKDK